MTSNVRAIKPPKDARSLVDFYREQRVAEQRANCAVCRLPDEIRDQVRAASGKKIPRAIVIGWLVEEHKIALTVGDLQGHAPTHDAPKAV